MEMSLLNHLLKGDGHVAQRGETYQSGSFNIDNYKQQVIDALCDMEQGRSAATRDVDNFISAHTDFWWKLVK